MTPASHESLGVPEGLLRGYGAPGPRSAAATAGGACPRRPGRGHVHLRHHRQPQGRHADPRKPDREYPVRRPVLPGRPVRPPPLRAPAQPHVRADGRAIRGDAVGRQHHIPHQQAAHRALQDDARAQGDPDAARPPGAGASDGGHRERGAQAGQRGTLEQDARPRGPPAVPREAQALRVGAQTARRPPGHDRLRRRRARPGAGRQMGVARRPHRPGLRRYRGVARDQLPPPGGPALRLRRPAGARTSR